MNSVKTSKLQVRKKSLTTQGYHAITNRIRLYIEDQPGVVTAIHSSVCSHRQPGGSKHNVTYSVNSQLVNFPLRDHGVLGEVRSQ